ncbi:MAG TPA: class A beta-lactamase [Polyangiaceae bacterium]|nr:class A beta-lactamase [Polyangiaceae bacterium]
MSPRSPIPRRRLLLAALGSLTSLQPLLLGGCAARVVPGGPPPLRRPEPPSFAAIEASVGGRVGVFALDTHSGRQLGHRADERFAMCSTFKWVLAAAVLSRVDRRELSLEERVPFSEADLLEYAPATRRALPSGGMSVGELAKAAVTVSDNTAANLLLKKVDGPSGLTRFMRSLGDGVTRLDRDEPTLNTNEPGDPRDTTSPRAMVGLLRGLLCGDALSPAGRARLLEWLRACETGRARLRAGVPAEWTVGDKTGTGRRGAANDVAIAAPPGRAPVLIAAYLSDGPAPPPALAAAHADIARRVVWELETPLKA